MCFGHKKEAKEIAVQKVVNTAVSIICIVALILICVEPAEGTSTWQWLRWEIVWFAVFIGSAAYLNKHLPDDD